MNLELTNKLALVIGSSKGLGFGIAQSLIAEGAKVILTGRNIERLQTAKQYILNNVKNAESDNVFTLAFDLADMKSINDNLDFIKKEYGNVDILINNCGGPPPKPISTVTNDEWLQYFNSMVLPTFSITSSLLPAMRENKWGRIINITSSGVIEPIPVLGISNTLRSSIVAWAKTLSLEVAKEGVTINCLSPGRIATERLDELDSNAASNRNTTIEQVKLDNYQLIPTGRYGSVEEFAAMAVFLASEKSSYITGSVHRIDGGMCKSI